MLAGSSPESGFAGLWRIIAVQSAPWSKPRKLTKTDAPLLEYAVAFADNEVWGPAPLACKNAKYSSGVTYPVELFGGALKNDKDGALAKKLNLASVETTTYRAVCGNVVRDYYMDDNADMLLGDGGVIYRLQRPTGMDPEQYAAGFSGPSFDCTQAKTTGEELICFDAALSKSDSKLGAEYNGLKKSLSPESFATFQAAQKAWVAYTMKVCGANVPMPDNSGDRGTITDCLSQMYSDRAELLDGIKLARSGSLLIEPRVRFRVRATPVTEETDIYPFMSSGPQAAALNAYVSKILNLDKWRMDDKGLFRFDDVEDMKLFVHRYFGVERFYGRVVSLRIGTEDFTGGRDVWRGGSTLNWDLATNKPITFDDVFVKGEDWKKFVLAFSTKTLAKKGKDDGMEVDLTFSDLQKQIANSANWLWDKNKATVIFDLLVNGSPTDVSYDVDIPYTKLKPYLRSDAIVLVKP